MPEIIRVGDPTSHGGKVVEGSPFDICHGKPIAYLGHKVYCPKCKGTFPIAEGAMTTSLYGKGVALAGMKTSCGATLIATQSTDVVEYGGGGDGDAKTASAKSGPAHRTNTAPGKSAESGQLSGELKCENEARTQFDEQSHLMGNSVEGVPYFIETKDGRTFTGQAPHDGMLPRVETDEAVEYSVYWADEALARMIGAD